MKRWMFFLTLFLIGFVSAEEYYVSNSGNDSWNGKSDATAWKTVGKVNSFNFAVGDDVYFKCGGIWNQALVVDWSGNETDGVTIGTYDNCEEKGRPILDGTNSVPGEWDGLIQITNSFVNIENFVVRNSAGMGIRILNSNNVRISNCTIYHVYKQGIDFYNSDEGILEYSDISDANNFGNGAVTRAYGSRNCIFRYNKIHESKGWSEGINALHSDNLYIIGNIIFDTRAALIYLDHAVGTVVKYNLLYYTDNESYWRYLGNESFPSDGIWISDEKPQGMEHRSENITIANNIIVGVRHGIILTSNSNTSCGLIESEIVNNLIVQPRVMSIKITSSPRHQNSFVVNNIFYQSLGEIADVTNSNEISFSNNFWSQDNYDSDALGNGDIVYSENIFLNEKDWLNLKSDELDFDDFSFIQNISAIGGGVEIPNFEIGLISSNFPFLNFLNQNDDWDMGAFVYQETVNPPVDVVDVSDIFEKISEWKAGQISLDDVFVVIRAWGEGGWL